jgi:hypothetical protein
MSPALPAGAISHIHINPITMHPQRTSRTLDGTLPFVGRSEEHRRLTAFWELTGKADGVYAGLLIGEAGAGKSRLLEEALPAIEGAGGTVIHTKLYPHSSTSIIELIGHAVAGAGARGRLSMRPDDNAASPADRLRRLARIRRTLLVIEDVHLLDDEGFYELAELLGSLADAPIGVLCAARPVALKATGILEDYLVETIHLKGLSMEDISSIWRTVFQAEADVEVVAQLHEITGGNCLALHSTLRSASALGALGRDINGDLRVGPMFASLARHRSARIAQGLMLHLTPEEREAASRLALLGEVFAHEAASELLPDAASMLARLIDRQIVTTIEQPVLPLAGVGHWTKPLDKVAESDIPESAFPLLSFTHSLLHRQLVQTPPRSSAVWPALAHALAIDVPLYSLTPIRFLRTMCETASADDLRALFYRVCMNAFFFDGSMIPTAIQMADAARDMLRYLATDSAGDLEILRAEILHAQLWTRQHEFDGDEYRELFDDFARLTENPQTTMMASYRFAWYDCRMCCEPFGRYYESARSELEALLARFPELATQEEFIVYMRIAVRDMFERNFAEAETLERRLDEFAAIPGVLEKFRWDIYLIRLFFVEAYTTPEELAFRRQRLESLRDEFGEEAEPFVVAQFKLLRPTGWWERLLEIAEPLANRLSQTPSIHHLLNVRMTQFFAISGFEPDRERIDAEARRLIDRFSRYEHQTLLLVVGHIVSIALHRGDSAWVRDLIAMLPPETGETTISRRLVFLAHVLLLDIAALRRDLTEAPHIAGRATADLVTAMIAVSEGTTGIDTLLPHIAAHVARPMAKINDLVYLHALFTLIGHVRDRGTESGSKKNDSLGEAASLLASHLEAWMEWLAERSLFVPINLLLDRYREALEPGLYERWRSHAETIEREWQVRQAKRSSDRIEITMLDGVLVRKPGEDEEPIRGARMRALLALMVADRMIESPLTTEDFRELIAGDEADVEHPRKVMNLTVFRLREILGNEVILTDRETPRLNLDRVRVDLLEADALLRDAQEHLRNGDLARAMPAVVAALDIAGTGTPFPNLYDRFFEAMRDDFESRLRSAVLKTGRLALVEGDAESAERLLRRGVAALAGDEDVADLLAEALVAQSRSAEAERVRAQSGGVESPV